MTEERKEQYKTLLIICGGFALIGWRLHHPYLLVIAAVILVLGLASVFMLAKIAEAWMWIGEKIGAVMSRVILSVVFVFFLTPLKMHTAFNRNALHSEKLSIGPGQRNFLNFSPTTPKVFGVR